MNANFIPPKTLKAFRFIFIDHADYRLNTQLPTLTRSGIQKFVYVGTKLDWSSERYPLVQVFTAPFAPALIAGGIIAANLSNNLVGDEQAPLIPVSEHIHKHLLGVAREDFDWSGKADCAFKVCSDFFERIMVGSSTARIMVFVGSKDICWALAYFLDQHFNSSEVIPVSPTQDGEHSMGITVPFSRSVSPYFHKG